MAFFESEDVEAGLALDKFGIWTPVWSGDIFHFHLCVDLEQGCGLLINKNLKLKVHKKYYKHSGALNKRGALITV